MEALEEYRAARRRQAEAERAAYEAQMAADAWLLVIRDEFSTPKRSAGPDRLSKILGEGRSSVAKRLERALHGTPRPRGGVR